MKEEFGFETRPLPPEIKARLLARECEKKRLAKMKRERIWQWGREHAPQVSKNGRAYA